MQQRHQQLKVEHLDELQTAVNAALHESVGAAVKGCLLDIFKRKSY